MGDNVLSSLNWPSLFYVYVVSYKLFMARFCCAMQHNDTSYIITCTPSNYIQSTYILSIDSQTTIHNAHDVLLFRIIETKNRSLYI